MRQYPRFAIVLLSPLLLLLTSCSTTHIAGLDRVFFPDSSAKVGPLVNADEQYPLTVEIEPESEIVALPSVADSEVESKVVIKNAPSVESKPKKKIQGTKPELVTQPLIKGAGVNVTQEKAVAPLEKKTQEQALIGSSKEQVNAPAKVKLGAVSGQVVLIAEGGESLSAAGTLITLTPKKINSETQTNAPKTHVIDMENKEYQPQYSNINAGDQIVFVNKDNIQHNVFSPSGNNAFDLGTYGSGLKRAVTLTKPGIVKIYCNIHADMATFVAVGDSGLSVKADDQGRYKIDQLPLGTYDMTIWNIRGETKRTIEIKNQETLQLADRIDTRVVKSETHKNKHGGNYSKNSALFKDEFY